MKLSIITINLNNDIGLEKTIQSVVTQTFSDFEYIVIDGGSSDKSIDIIKKYSSEIKYWVSEPDHGIYHAMNKGIVKANGEYCLFLNSGDFLLGKDILKRIFASEHTQDILYGHVIFAYGSDTLVKKMPSSITLKHMIRSTLWHPASFIKKELLVSLGMYDESLKIVADYDLFLKAIFLNKCSLCHLNETISLFSYTGISSLPANSEIIAAEKESVQLRYFCRNQIDDAMRKNFFEIAINKLKKLIPISKINNAMQFKR